jgi:4-hydroxybenzoate polyprenyltransferase
MKRQIARRVNIDPAALPYREDVVAFVDREKQAGRRVVLATASDARIAQPIAAHLGLFDALLASDGRVNLKGLHKLAAIEADVRAAGAHGFSYMGDSRADEPIWAASAEPIVVPRSSAVTRRLRQSRGPTTCPFDPAPHAPRCWTSLLRAMRPHQWTKNLLLLVPLARAHQVGNPALLAAALLGMLVFSLSASSVYRVNDLLDLAADRTHPTKRHRPIAAGRLSLAAAAVAAALLLLAAFALAAMLLPRAFITVLGVYWLVTTAYSLLLKRLVVFDVLTLAGLYTLRLRAGGAATGVWVSPWLIAFSLCIFVSLALLKRYIELRVAAAVAMQPQATGATAAASRLGGRGYALGARRPVAWVGIAAGAASTLVMAAYVNSHAVRMLYASPAWLLLVCPLLLVWITRIWWRAWGDKVADDPVLYALKDWSSYVIGAAIVAVSLLAKLA